MLDVTARQLRAFLAVARVENITRAADTLGLTPSPVGRAIREFEEAAQEVLFIRDNRVTVLTEAGHRVLPAVVEALALLDGLGTHDTTKLKIAAAATAAASSAEAVFTQASEVAGLPIERSSGDHDALLQNVRFGDVDVLVTDQPVDAPGLESFLLPGADPAAVAGAAQSHLVWRVLDVQRMAAIERLVASLGGPKPDCPSKGLESSPARSSTKQSRKSQRATAAPELDIADVRVLVALSRQRSVRVAAESLGLTASPVSRTVRDIETRLGGPLLERQHDGMEPTALLASLLPRAVEILALLASIPPAPAMLRVGFSSWSPERYRERLLAGATDAGLPRIDLVEATQRELIAQLLHGEIDLMVHNAWRDLPGAVQRRLGVIHFHVFSADEPVTTEEVATTADIGDRTVIALPQITAPTLFENLVRVFGAEQVLASTGEQLLTLDSRMRRTGAVMVAAGAHDTALWHLLDRPGIVGVPLDDTVIGTLNVEAAWRPQDLVKLRQIELAYRTMQGPGQRIDRL